jgi:hypothetical protein
MAKQPKLNTFDANMVTGVTKAAMRRALERVAPKMVKALQDVINDPYPPPSRPGTPPHRRTGLLRNTLQAVVVGHNRIQILGVHYGASLEHGTQHIAPRPFLDPTITQQMDKWNALVQQYLAEEFQGQEHTLSAIQNTRLTRGQPSRAVGTVARGRRRR